MNNSLIGRTMENLGKRVIIKLITSEFFLIKWVYYPGFKSCKIFNENLVPVHNVKEALGLNKMIYAKLCILKLSAKVMHDFHYNFIMKKYRNDSQSLFTDNDFLCYEIKKTEDFYKIRYEKKNLFDLSDMPDEFKETTNKKIVGKIKDEIDEIPIKEFNGLRS